MSSATRVTGLHVYCARKTRSSFFVEEPFVKLRLLAVFAGCVVVAACGGGGGGGATPSAPAATPTPIVTPQPTPTPGALSSSTQSISLIGTTNAVPFTISSTAYAGAFNISGCTGIVTVSPGTANGPSAGFNATATNAGTCTLTVSDTIGRSVTINVTATITTGTIQ